MEDYFRKSIEFDSLMECENIAESTEEILWSDDETIVAEQEVLWNQDLAAIRRLLDPDKNMEKTIDNSTIITNPSLTTSSSSSTTTTTTTSSSFICPSCQMPFDKGKKRRLIDNCGHERCYTCMFSNETCPLCTLNHENHLFHSNNSNNNNNNGNTINYSDDENTNNMHCNGLRGSEITLYGDIQQIENKIQQKSTKIKTDPFSNLIRKNRSELSPVRSYGGKLPPKTPPRPPPPNTKNKSSSSHLLPNNNVLIMTQSCPTPPQSTRRNKFFQNSKSILRSPFLGRNWRQQQQQQSTDGAMSVSMTTSATSESSKAFHWPSLVLGKIRSLWWSDVGQNNIGLNQLASDDEASVKSTSVKKSSENDMYMRLGLLLGDGARRNKVRQTYNLSPDEAYSSSMTSYETTTNTVMSNNTSPVSTLTGSSEDPHLTRINHPPTISSDSIGSLMSMSMSGQSNCSSSTSPISQRRQRRHSLTNTTGSAIVPASQTDVRNSRRTCLRRSGRGSGSAGGGIAIKSALDTKLRFPPQYKAPQLTLKPLFFEVPLQEPEPLFIGRQWMFKKMEEIISSSSPGILLTGIQGTGKTALILQLVEHSCFGRRKDQVAINQRCSSSPSTSPSRPPHHPYQHPLLLDSNSEKIKQLASSVVAYHFCQADNNNTCLVPDFIHSLAAQLCQAPQLAAYREYLLNETTLQNILSLKECIANPDRALTRGILEPLIALKRVSRIDNNINFTILIDALCEAEYHRPDNGDTITTFLIKHIGHFPPWLKLIVTIRTHLQELTKQFPFTRMSLDSTPVPAVSDNIQKDILAYVNYRLQNSTTIQNNITISSANGNGKSTSSLMENGNLCQHKFAQHLLNLSQGSFLFVKLTMDLLERGQLVAKSSGYKVLPVTLSQIYLLHFNLRFPTIRSYEKVIHILSVCLAALYPLTLLEIFYSVNSLLVDNFLAWKEFLQRFKLLSGFLVKRLDNTYMFFHPSFREWLIRRDDNEATKFLCDLRSGHAAIAFRLSRLQAPLDAEKTLELGHHILKAHVYRNMSLVTVMSRDLQAYWITESSENVSAAVCHIRNIYSSNVKVSRLLLLAGASPNYISEFHGKSPILCIYASEGNVPMVALLLEFGADVELTNSQGQTALSTASAQGHCDVVRQLIAAGSSPGHADTVGYCPLVHAARNGCLNVVGYLLACDWIIKNVNDDVELAEAAQQALIAAAGHGHTEIVEYLLDMAEVNADMSDSITGETALTVAAANGCHLVCSALISRGANISIKNKKEMTPLLIAVKEGHWAVAERLIQNHADAIEQIDSAGRTALMLAASEGHLGLIDLLLDKGSEINKIDNDGLSPLCWACLNGKLQAAQSLIERGADINQPDNNGRTPLDLAAFHGNPTLIQFLLDRGALIEHVDIKGMRPLDRAIGCKNIQAVHCFLKKGAKLGPATWAMAAGKSEIMLILLNKLLEDGNVLYRRSRLREAAHRYQYALKKFPSTNDQHDHNEHAQAFRQLKINFLLNYSRCKRKLNEPDEAIELANEALAMKPESYEAYYALAKARLDLNEYDEALRNVQEAMTLLTASSANNTNPNNSGEVKKVLIYLQEEIFNKMSPNSSNRMLAVNRNFTVSVDTLNHQ